MQWQCRLSSAMQWQCSAMQCRSVPQPLAVQSNLCNALVPTGPPTKPAYVCACSTACALPAVPCTTGGRASSCQGFARVLPGFCQGVVGYTVESSCCKCCGQDCSEPSPSTYSTTPLSPCKPPPSCRALQRCNVPWPSRPHWRPGLRRGASCCRLAHWITVRTRLHRGWRQALLSLQRSWVPITAATT